MSDTAQDILLQLQKNEMKLAEIANFQQEMLRIEQQRLVTERMQMFSSWARLALIILITWLSFVAAKQLMGTVTQQMGGLMGGQELQGADALTKQLKGSEELLRELMGQ